MRYLLPFILLPLFISCSKPTGIAPTTSKNAVTFKDMCHDTLVMGKEKYPLTILADTAYSYYNEKTHDGAITEKIHAMGHFLKTDTFFVNIVSTQSYSPGINKPTYANINTPINTKGTDYSCANTSYNGKIAYGGGGTTYSASFKAYLTTTAPGMVPITLIINSDKVPQKNSN